jgi:hypothetical protein
MRPIPAPQQSVISPAKKIRPDRCGAATLTPEHLYPKAINRVESAGPPTEAPLPFSPTSSFVGRCRRGPASTSEGLQPRGPGDAFPGAATWATLCWEPGPRADGLSRGAQGRTHPAHRPVKERQQRGWRYAAQTGQPLGSGKRPRASRLNEGVRDALVMWELGAASGKGRSAHRRRGRRPGPGTAARASDAAPSRWRDGRSTALPARAVLPAGGCSSLLAGEPVDGAAVSDRACQCSRVLAMPRNPRSSRFATSTPSSTPCSPASFMSSCSWQEPGQPPSTHNRSP